MDRSGEAGKACRKRYCQLDWCFVAARHAIIRKGRTTSVHHIWQTFPNMVTSTSKYGSRGRPLDARCTTARPHSRRKIGRTEPRAGDPPSVREAAEPGGFFEVGFGADPRADVATALRRTTFSRRGRVAVGARSAATRGGIAAATAAAAADAAAAAVRHVGQVTILRFAHSVRGERSCGACCCLVFL